MTTANNTPTEETAYIFTAEVIAGVELRLRFNGIQANLASMALDYYEKTLSLLSDGKVDEAKKSIVASLKARLLFQGVDATPYL